MRVDWNSLKTFINNTNLYKNINYFEMQSNYLVWLYYEGESFSTLLDKGSANCQEFISDFKSKAVLKNNIADDGIQMTRTTFVGRSRMLRCIFTNFQTSSFNLIDTSGLFTIKLKDENNNYTNNVQESTITELTFCPGKDVGYSMYGGGIQTLDDIDSEVYIDTILAPEISESNGGNIYFIKNRLIKPPSESFFINAINAGDVLGIENYNIIRIIIRHNKGMNKKLQAQIQLYI
jgi:hypothetical protein